MVTAQTCGFLLVIVNVLVDTSAQIKASSQVKALSLLPSLQCLDNKPYQTGGLVIK